MAQALRLRSIAASMVVLLLAGAPLAAHEFWLEVTDYKPDTGDVVAVTHFVGENFKGESFPYVRGWFQKYVIADAKQTRDAKGVDGNDPALKLTLEEPGLTILAYQSNPNAITFKSWPKFQKYLKDEGLERFEALHRSSGKPLTQIQEYYTRCAKALIGVAGGKGEDRAIGLPLELVALRNPYNLSAGDRLPVRVLFQGKPVGGVLIKAFNKDTPTKPLRIRTDTEGRAEIPLRAPGVYLLNAVHMMEPTGIDVKGQTYQWQSLWASLTFALP
jgi:hypothetical protein